MAIHMKFNPGVKGDSELITSFVARAKDLQTLLRLLFSEGKNVLVVGPRGSGKTTLVRRLAAEIRRDDELSRKWTPLVFAEESYEICSVGEFWLEAVYRLCGELREKRWELVYESLKKEPSHQALSKRAFAALRQYCDETGRNLLIVAENLTLIVDEQLDAHAGAELVDVLEKEHRFRFVGTTLPSFEESQVFDCSWAERFQGIQLKPLSLSDCKALWHSVASSTVSSLQMRPVQILTGGNPRLIRILADFAGKASFRGFMDDIVHLVDEHTEYFKSRLDNLPPSERKVFVAILQRWDPMSARDIADDTRIEITGVSPLLLRLQKRGIISAVEGKGRKVYQASERLYNIYYLLRRGGHAQENRVRLAVRFMVQFYRGRRLIDRARKLAVEACSLAPNQRKDHYLAYRELFNCSISTHLKDQIRSAIPQEFLEAIPGISPEVANSETLVAEANHLFLNDKSQEAEQLLRRAIEISPDYGHARAHLAVVLEQKGAVKEALKEFRLAMLLAPDDRWAALRFAQFLWKCGSKEEASSIIDRILETPDFPNRYLEHLSNVLHDTNRFEESVQVCLRWVAVAPQEDLARAWWDLAELYHYHLRKYPEAHDAYRKSLEANDSPSILAHYADLLEFMGKKEERARVIQSAVSQLQAMAKNARVWALLGQILLDKLDNVEAAIDAFRKGCELAPEIPEIWIDLGRALGRSGALNESETVLRKAISMKPNDMAYLFLGMTLKKLKRLKEAEDAFRNSIDLDPSNPTALTSLGMLLEEQQETEKAIECYSKAVSLGDDRAIPVLIQARARNNQEDTILASELRELLARPLDARVLNNAAWALCQSGMSPLLRLAEATVRRALVSDPKDCHATHTLAVILGALNRWEEALGLCRELVNAVALDHLPLQDLADLLIDAAAAGYAEQCLALLRASSAASALEPLIVGLELHVGEKPIVAQEILEVAKDVSGRIESKRMQAAPATESYGGI